MDLSNMRVLSLFDGISGAKQAIGDAEYFASEVDRYAIQVSKNNHPNIIHLGDVNTIDFSSLGEINLVIGGSPCQDLSVAKQNRKGLEGARSSLFYKFKEAIDIIKPTYFLLENVASMSQADANTISSELGVDPIMINSRLLTAQNRKRLYWCNWGVDQPQDRGVELADILEDGFTNRIKSHCLDANYFKGTNPKHYVSHHVRQMAFKSAEDLEKLATNYTKFSSVTKFRSKNSSELTYKTDENGINFRILTPIECERLQGYPDNYTAGISNTQRYKCLGNSFTVPIIKHILGHIGI